MTILYAIGLILTVLLGIYLVVALLFAEDF